MKFLALLAGVCVMPMLSSCSDKDDEPPHYDDYEIIGFTNVPSSLIGGPTAYGENLYYGAENQITKGYIAKIDDDVYAQFSVNYAEQPWTDGKPWQYTFFNGGIAVSNWHNMTIATYENQLSVYSQTSPSGGNFAVAFGNSLKTDPTNAVYSDYEGCGRIYITDSKGYGVAQEGDKNNVSGVAKFARFDSMQIANTTYTYLTMKDGNAYAPGVNADNKGWFKVQFIAFDSTDPKAKPTGYVEAYLANFDPALETQAGYCGNILDKWTSVDLSKLPECTVLVINFDGSDKGDYGLNTPSYCALDNIVVEEID